MEMGSEYQYRSFIAGFCRELWSDKEEERKFLEEGERNMKDPRYIAMLDSIFTKGKETS